MARVMTLAAAGILALAAVLMTAYEAVRAQRSAAPVIDVFKTTTCGCCALWVEHLRTNGFEVRITELEQAGVQAVKVERGVPQNLYSCHTGVVGNYAIEGHVPAGDIRRLLEERPAIAGVSVPGMPIGSPGMEVGTSVQPYDVVAFDRAGGRRVFASYGR